MRRSLFTLAVVVMVLFMVGAYAVRRGKATESSGSKESNTVQAPGTRCTRLRYGPKEKKSKQAVPGQAVPGTRCTRLSYSERKGDYLPNQPPTVDLKASVANITLPCKSGETSTACATDACQITILNARATDPDADTMLYTYTTTGGRINGDGSAVIWDLKGAEPGTYTASVEVDDGCGCIAFNSATVTIASCSDCR
jgi:hypothetical protein